MPQTSASVDPSGPVLLVGQDDGGHWIVRERTGTAGGVFVSREAAFGYAHHERLANPRARIEVVNWPLTLMRAA